MDGLGINLPSLITQFVNFGILLALLWLFLHKPLARVLDERRRRIAEGLQASETAQVEAEEAKVQAEAQIQGGREQGQELVAQAQAIAERIQSEARTAATSESETLLERARQEIQRERDIAIAQLRSEFADLTIRAAERVIGQSLDAGSHERLIDEVLSDSSLGSQN
ncbi:MAG: F-type H+-transporting ATPase subunit b [Chloroflexi bacterium]|nr:MAG: F-type H+-transporting ATPase subunit b [Chloroflexota bacterium]